MKSTAAPAPPRSGVGWLAVLDEAHKFGRSGDTSRLEKPDSSNRFFAKNLRLLRIGAPAVVGGKPDRAIAILERMVDLSISCVALYIRILKHYSI
jgi:hypothetical protein